MALSFNGATKVISLGSGDTELSVRELWTEWVDWWNTSDNSKYPVAMTQIGGESIDESAGTIIPVYVYLQNGWKVKPQEASHTLNVYDGILLVQGGGDPFNNTNGSFVVRINYQQPVQAISFDTGEGGGGGLTAAQVWQRVIEGGVTAEEMMRIIISGLAGLVSGAGTGTELFKSMDGTKTRIESTVDEDGNRTAVTLDGS